MALLRGKPGQKEEEKKRPSVARREGGPRRWAADIESTSMNLCAW